MSQFDDLPKRNKNHVVEDKSMVAFEKCLSDSETFILQTADRKDYGTDCQIEIVDQDRATNVRIYVQLKGTERKLNSDGTVSVDVSRTNLNYLLAQPYSFYVCYHLPTDSLRFCLADEVLRQYEHSGKNWTDQRTLTVSFNETLMPEKLRTFATLARSSATSFRDRRIRQIAAPAMEVPDLLRKSVPDVYVPADRASALQLLEQLYEHGADEVISAGFDKFAAVLDTNDDSMGSCYMAEINLGMSGNSEHIDRIAAAIGHFRSKIDGGLYHPSSLQFTIGNAFSALGKEVEAVVAYEAALADHGLAEVPALAALIHKNLGTSIEHLGDEERAAAHYTEALCLNPDLPEAHNALGHYHIRNGRYEEALHHFDRVVFCERENDRISAVAGWRTNILFNLEDGRAAFREINSLLSQATSQPWIWPWCARQVACFGRATVDNARHALNFWQRYVAAHPHHSQARRELLLTMFFLRSGGHDPGKVYDEFRAEFDLHIAHIDEHDAALPWDRLGHWAQDENDWVEAERCFRRAFELEGGHYGYCLGTALNFLGRFDESLPILLEQASQIQPDAMSWFQTAVAYENLNYSEKAIEAFRRALVLDPSYDLAMFNLGGTFWNCGYVLEAAEVWAEATQRFPDHELTAQLKRDFPSIFRDIDSNEP